MGFGINGVTLCRKHTHPIHSDFDAANLRDKLKCLSKSYTHSEREVTGFQEPKQFHLE